jgi:hypothetical protein
MSAPNRQRPSGSGAVGAARRSAKRRQTWRRAAPAQATFSNRSSRTSHRRLHRRIQIQRRCPSSTPARSRVFWLTRASHRRHAGRRHAAEKIRVLFVTGPAAMTRCDPLAAAELATVVTRAARRCGVCGIANGSGCSATRRPDNSNAFWNMKQPVEHGVTPNRLPPSSVCNTT